MKKFICSPAYSVIFGLAFILGQPSADAMNLSLVGGVNRHSPSLNPDPPSGNELSTKSAFSFGMLADLPIAESYQFEFGVIRHARSNETSYKGWLLPLTLRFMRAEFFGFGFGPYLAFMSAGVNNPNQKGFEMGVRASLRGIVPVWNEMKLLCDVSYLLGFTDMNKSGVAEDKNQEWLFLLGLQLPINSESSGESKP